MEGALNADEAKQALVALREHISADQHAAATLMLTGGMKP
jgi:hypothetical protein